MFSLRFDQQEIEQWASRYSYPKEDYIVNVISPRMKSAGYLTRLDFIKLCHWKTPRSKPKVESNSEEFIHEVTRTAFSTSSEQLRVEVLTLLRGVGWPTASVILHFGHAEPYPILDVRALWSLGVTYPAARYDFAFWQAYTSACRALAIEAGVDMRTLDRALWQYSKEHQPSLKLASREG
jgi:hypothetical protein